MSRSNLKQQFQTYAQSISLKKESNVCVNLRHYRIVTYNVHFWSDLYDKGSFNRICQDLINLNADVICLQEVSFDRTKFLALNETQLQDHWVKLGYPYSVEIRCTPFLGAPLGNLILSRYPIIKTQSQILPLYKSKVKRGYCSAQIPALNLNIACVHLDVFDETGITRRLQLEELLRVVPDYVICGDFNCTQVSDYSSPRLQHIQTSDQARGIKTDLETLQIITQQGYDHSFNQLNQTLPLMTVWSNRIVDYIWFKHKNPVSTNIYPTINSDHFPVYCDFS